ncbi:Dipeptidyl aminopeptidase BI [Vitis vinifera]|uniref:Dipeptidyl aminopeptidase BI n=1 Tax=Vitis vinifera TaxID=29760 RepID=A0A438FP53_VITVI|nr:Dipeptidyl aminopeptidase BI [Vitis vinifera]
MASHLLRCPTRSSSSLTLGLLPKFKVVCSLFSSLCRRKPSPFSAPRDAPPVPKKVPFTVSAHGTSWQDPYHWMSNTADPDLSAYLRHENSYAEAFMADTLNLQRTLFSEMNSRMPTNISTPTERWGPWLYYQYIPEGKEYPVLCRKLATQTNGWAKSFLNNVIGEFGREKVLLDWNEIAEEYGKLLVTSLPGKNACPFLNWVLTCFKSRESSFGSKADDIYMVGCGSLQNGIKADPRLWCRGYVHVGTCRVSPDHNFLAYTLDITGSERFMLQIKDLHSGCILPDLRVDGVLAWHGLKMVVLYSIQQQMKPTALQANLLLVQCIKLGSDAVNDVPVFTESDPSFCVDITSTKDGKFITVNSNSRSLFPVALQVFVINATNPEEGLRRMNKRVPGVQYFLEHHHGFFYILTNAPLTDKELSVGDYYLARCQVDDVQLANWQVNLVLFVS